MALIGLLAEARQRRDLGVAETQVDQAGEERAVDPFEQRVRQLSVSNSGSLQEHLLRFDVENILGSNRPEQCQL